MPSIGLVLSAGGVAARAYHAGTLAAVATQTGWDPRGADLVVGTSAGASAGAFLRGGVSAADDYARYVGGTISPEGEALLERIRPFEAPDDGRGDHRRLPRRPLRPSLALRALAGRTGPVTGLAGLAPRGDWRNLEVGARIADLMGDRWAAAPLWVCAVRVRDGRRVVFGRDDVPTPDLATAVQASCAIPRVVEPVRVGSVEYIDGATHSSTNADLVAPLAFDLVVVVSSMTAVPAESRFTPTAPGLMWYSRLLRREVEAIRARGTEVLVVQPIRADLDARRGPAAEPRAIAAQAFRSAETNLARPRAARARALLEAAAYVPEGAAR
jgi:NTE family protein